MSEVSPWMGSNDQGKAREASKRPGRRQSSGFRTPQASASGNLNFTGTITPRNVVAEDEEGNLYAVRGALWFGAAFNANTGGEVFTFTGKLQIVSGGGGTADSVNMTFHVTAQPNNIVLKDFDFGTCEEPS